MQVATWIPRKRVRTSLPNQDSIKWRHDPCFGVKANLNRPSFPASRVRVSRETRGAAAGNQVDAPVRRLRPVKPLDGMNELAAATAPGSRMTDMPGCKVESGHERHRAVCIHGPARPRDACREPTADPAPSCRFPGCRASRQARCTPAAASRERRRLPAGSPPSCTFPAPWPSCVRIRYRDVADGI